jgi:hypothetical protein
MQRQGHKARNGLPSLLAQAMPQAARLQNALPLKDMQL